MRKKIKNLNRDVWVNSEHWRCPQCRSVKLFKCGFVHGRQRYQCKNCDSVTIKPKGSVKR
jgi:transposase-like protein